VEVDGRSLPAPIAPTTVVSVPVSLASNAQRLQLVWAGDVGDPAPTAADVPSLAADGEPIPMGPILWTVRASTGRLPLGDVAPLHPAAAALYRAAAQVRLAEAARASGPAGATAVRAALTRASVELRAADAATADGSDVPAGPNGVPLAEWRQQLRDAVRTPGPAAEPQTRDDLPYDDAFARGSSSAWYVPVGDDGPRLTWPPPRPDWPARLLRTLALVMAGVVGLWLGHRFGPAAWPEQLAVLGLAAWIADASILWLAPTTAGLAVRAILLAGAGLRRWRAAGVSATGEPIGRLESGLKQ
jgi:hypothetical protein